MLFGFCEVMQNLADIRYLHQHLSMMWFLLKDWEFQHFAILGSVFLTSSSSERCHHTICHVFLIALNEPSLIVQHGLGLLPLLLLWISCNTNARSAFLDSYLLTFV